MCLYKSLRHQNHRHSMAFWMDEDKVSNNTQLSTLKAHLKSFLQTAHKGAGFTKFQQLLQRNTKINSNLSLYTSQSHAVCDTFCLFAGINFAGFSSMKFSVRATRTGFGGTLLACTLDSTAISRTLSLYNCFSSASNFCIRCSDSCKVHNPINYRTEQPKAIIFKFKLVDAIPDSHVTVLVRSSYIICLPLYPMMLGICLRFA